MRSYGPFAVDGKKMVPVVSNRADLSAPVPSLYSKDFHPAHISGLNAFIEKNSILPLMAECAAITYRHCKLHCCPWCDLSRSQALRADWLPRIPPAAPSVYVRLSVASSHSLEAAWADLRAARARFGRRSWLSSQCASWFRSTEVTLSRGMWNVHDNIVVLGTPEDLEAVRRTVAAKWAAAAAAVGVEAVEGAQYAKHARSTVAVREYVLKGVMAYASDPSRGRTPGNLIRDWSQGDPDAGEHFREFENFIGEHPKGLHFTQRGGEARQKADYDLAS